MIPDGSESPSDVQQQTNVNYYFSLVSFTLLYYEYFLTLDWEVSRYWRYRHFSWASFFFYLNRYLALVAHFPVVVEYFWTTESPDKLELQSFHQYYAVVAQIVIAVMLIMRTYALYERNRIVLTVMIAVTLAAIAFGAWAVVAGKGGAMVEVDPKIGCPTALSYSSSIRLGAAWGGMLVFDTMVFTLTLYKAITIRRSSVSFLTILFRDGAAYWAVMILSNLGNILTFIFGGSRIRGVATTFTNVISSIMISRLMLNLRDPELNRTNAKRTPLSTTVVSDPVVSTVVDPYNGTAYTGFTIDPGWTTYVPPEEHDSRRREFDREDGGIELVTIDSEHDRRRT